MIVLKINNFLCGESGSYIVAILMYRFQQQQKNNFPCKFSVYETDKIKWNLC